MEFGASFYYEKKEVKNISVPCDAPPCTVEAAIIKPVTTINSADETTLNNTSITSLNWDLLGAYY